MTGCSGIKPRRMKALSFDGDPRNWSMFIQMLKVLVHDAVSSDVERMAHLYGTLIPEKRNRRSATESWNLPTYPQRTPEKKRKPAVRLLRVPNLLLNSSRFETMILVPFVL